MKEPLHLEALELSGSTKRERGRTPRFHSDFGATESECDVPGSRACDETRSGRQSRGKRRDTTARSWYEERCELKANVDGKTFVEWSIY